MLSREGSFYIPRGDEFNKVLSKLSYYDFEASNGFFIQNYVKTLNNISLFNSRLDFWQEKLKYKSKFSFFGSKKEFIVKDTFNKHFELFLKDTFIGLRIINKNLKTLFKMDDLILKSVVVDEVYLKKLDILCNEFESLYKLAAIVSGLISNEKLKKNKSVVVDFERLFLKCYGEISENYGLLYTKFNSSLNRVKKSF